MALYRVRAFLGDVYFDIEAPDEETAIERAEQKLEEQLEEIVDLAAWTIAVCTSSPMPMGTNPDCKVHGVKGD